MKIVKVSDNDIVRFDEDTSPDFLSNIPPNCKIYVFSCSDDYDLIGKYVLRCPSFAMSGPDQIKCIKNPGSRNEQTWYIDKCSLGIHLSDFKLLFPNQIDLDCALTTTITIPVDITFNKEGDYYKSEDESIYLKADIYGKYFKS